MALLAGVSYEPSTAATSASGATLIAMTAIDTTNLRVTFTAPANGIVLGQVAWLDSRRGHQPCSCCSWCSWTRRRSAAESRRTDHDLAQRTHYGAPFDCSFLVTGLTPSTSCTSNTRTASSSSSPRARSSTAARIDTDREQRVRLVQLRGVANRAFLSIREALRPQHGRHQQVLHRREPGVDRPRHDQSPADVHRSRVGQGSGRVLQGTAHGGSTSWPGVILGVLDGSTVRARGRALLGTVKTLACPRPCAVVHEADYLITGLTPTDQLQLRCGVRRRGDPSPRRISSTAVPDDTTGDNAWGGFVYQNLDSVNERATSTPCSSTRLVPPASPAAPT